MFSSRKMDGPFVHDSVAFMSFFRLSPGAAVLRFQFALPWNIEESFCCCSSKKFDAINEVHDFAKKHRCRAKTNDILTFYTLGTKYLNLRSAMWKG